jgi:hypothetical protein
MKLIGRGPRHFITGPPPPKSIIKVLHVYHNRAQNTALESSAEEPVIYFSILYAGGPLWPTVLPCRGVCDGLNLHHVFSYPCFLHTVPQNLSLFLVSEYATNSYALSMSTSCQNQWALQRAISNGNTVHHLCKMDHSIISFIRSFSADGDRIVSLLWLG